MMINTGKNKFPFTETQWQELEHQALIFKYMVSGIPLPPDLLFTIRRSRGYLDPSLPSNLFSPNVEWNCFKMGLGKKIDPEPGRCRRTDGKKWRCSKEAYADSKYCERHMHRGKNRSRKPVEVFKTTGNTNKKCFSSSQVSSTHIPLSKSLSSDDHIPFHHSSSSKTTTGFGLSPDQDSNTTLLLDSGFYSHTDTGYRSSSFYGVKEEVNHEQSFFSNQALEKSVRGFSFSSSMDDSWQLTPLNMSSSSSSSSTLSQRNNESCNYLQLQSFNEIAHKEQNQDEHQQQYFNVMRNDIKVIERKEETQKTIHHFFDEWPIRKEKDSWLDFDDKGSVSTTQLSISIPSYEHLV